VEEFTKPKEHKKGASRKSGGKSDAGRGHQEEGAWGARTRSND